VALVAVLAARGVVDPTVWAPPAVTGGDDVVGRVRAGSDVLDALG
jgi:hypothetical protein